jgi:hypothetical protein
MKTLDCFLKETTRNLEALGFLRDTFDPAEFVQISSKKEIDPTTGE